MTRSNEPAENPDTIPLRAPTLGALLVGAEQTQSRWGRKLLAIIEQQAPADVLVDVALQAGWWYNDFPDDMNPPDLDFYGRLPDEISERHQVVDFPLELAQTIAAAMIQHTPSRARQLPPHLLQQLELSNGLRSQILAEATTRKEKERLIRGLGGAR